MIKLTTTAIEIEDAVPSVESPSIWDSNGLVPLVGLILSASIAIIKEILKHHAEIKAKEIERIRWLETQNDLLAKTLIERQGEN